MLDAAECYMKTVRKIEYLDYHKGYKELFSVLSECGSLSEQGFIDVLNTRNSQGWITWVLEDTKDGRNILVATISLLLERKIYREGRYVGHIEDVIVLPEYQHLKLGTHLNALAIEEAKKMLCYKVILDCKADLELFYAKSGLKKSNIQMAQYF